MSLGNQNQKKGKIVDLNSNKNSKISRQRLNSFNRIQDDIRSKLQRSGVSAICYMGIEGGEFSGGLVGEPEIVAEALVVACKKNAAIFHLLDIVVKSCREAGFHQEEKKSEEIKELETSIGKLVDSGELDEKVRAIFEENKIIDLNQLSYFTEKEVKSWKGIGEKTLSRIRLLMIGAEIFFKEESN